MKKSEIRKASREDFLKKIKIGKHTFDLSHTRAKGPKKGDPYLVDEVHVFMPASHDRPSRAGGLLDIIKREESKEK